MTPRAIVFGAGGQDGYYMQELLSREGVEGIGVSRSAGSRIQGSVTDRALVEDLVRTYQPHFVFHFAANSTTQHAALFENHETISTGTLTVLEAVYNYSPTTKVFLSGSALQFANQGHPIDESTEWAPSSPYAIARIHSAYAARYYRQLGVETYVGYLFNHDSPRRSERHMTQKIAQAARRIASGSLEMLEIGNMDVRKEYTFAGDVVRAIWALVNNDRNVFECVIGSGKAYSIAEWVRLCFDQVNVRWEERVVQKPGFKPEYDVLVSNPRLIHTLGWQPKVEIQDLAKLMLA